MDRLRAWCRQNCKQRCSRVDASRPPREGGRRHWRRPPGFLASCCVTLGLARIRFMTALVLSSVTVLLAGGCSSSTPTGDRKDLISIELRPKTTTAPAVGVAYPLSIAVRNDATRSESVPITLTLTSPDGKHVDFYTTSVFAYASKESTEDLVTTPRNGSAKPGATRSQRRARLCRPPPSWPSTSSTPRLATPMFADVSEQAGVATSIPAAHCGQFANGRMRGQTSTATTTPTSW